MCCTDVTAAEQEAPCCRAKVVPPGSHQDDVLKEVIAPFYPTFWLIDLYLTLGLQLNTLAQELLEWPQLVLGDFDESY